MFCESDCRQSHGFFRHNDVDRRCFVEIVGRNVGSIGISFPSDTILLGLQIELEVFTLLVTVLPC